MKSAEELHVQYKNLKEEINFVADEAAVIERLIIKIGKEIDNHDQASILVTYMDEFLERKRELKNGVNEIMSYDQRIAELLEDGIIDQEEKIFQDHDELTKKVAEQKDIIKTLKESLFDFIESNNLVVHHEEED